jgi:hypothetical protein
MNRNVIVIIATVGVLALASVGSCVSFYNQANRLENATTAQVKSNMAEYDTMWKTVAEVAQVPVKYKEDFKDILLAETNAKFGEDGSNATVQWFSERDLKLPPELYGKVQTVIEANRASFKRGQNDLADKQRRYADHLGSVGGRFWSGITGHPRVVAGEHAPPKDLDGDGKLTVLDYPIITSAKTEAVFESGREDEPMKVF